MFIKHSSSCIEPKDFDYIKDIVNSNFVGVGQYAQNLTKKLSRISNKRYVLLVNNGSNALLLALIALKNLHKDKTEVVTSGYICAAAANSINQAGLKPVLADINSYDLNINVESVKKNISKKVLAIIAPSIGGIPINLDNFNVFGVPVINDCCQSLGSKINGNDCTSFGDVSILSFGSTKIITGGTGGAVLADNRQLFEIMQELSKYEKTEEFYKKNGFIDGYNVTLPDLNAGLILAQLERLDEMVNKRRKIAESYDKLFLEKNVQIRQEKKGERFNRYRYYVLTKNKDLILNKLKNYGIDARESIGHNLAYYLGVDDLTNLNNLFNKVLSVPIYPNFKEDEKLAIFKAIHDL